MQSKPVIIPATPTIFYLLPALGAWLNFYKRSYMAGEELVRDELKNCMIVQSFHDLAPS